MIAAVIDTNILVSALRTKYEDASTRQVLDAVLAGKVQPLVAPEILEEYRDVLMRPKFAFDPSRVERVLRYFEVAGARLAPMPSDENHPDEDDRIFYEIALAGQDRAAKLVTGNLRHFPQKPFLLTAEEFLSLL